MVRDRLLPGATLKGVANLLVMPSLDAASAAYNLVKAVTGAITIGPILIGPRLPAHIVNATVTSRGIVNMSAVACVHAIGAARQDRRVDEASTMPRRAPRLDGEAPAWSRQHARDGRTTMTGRDQLPATLIPR